MSDRIAELEARIFDALDDIPEALALAELVEIARKQEAGMREWLSSAGYNDIEADELISSFAASPPEGETE